MQNTTKLIDSQIVLLSILYQLVFDIFIDLSLYHDLPWVGPEVPQGGTEMTKRLSLRAYHQMLILFILNDRQGKTNRQTTIKSWTNEAARSLKA